MAAKIIRQEAHLVYRPQPQAHHQVVGVVADVGLLFSLLEKLNKTGVSLKKQFYSSVFSQ